jgi:serine/threonine protein kinase
MSDPASSEPLSPLSSAVVAVKRHFESAWAADEPPWIGDFIAMLPDLMSPIERRSVLWELVAIDALCRWNGSRPSDTARLTSSTLGPRGLSLPKDRLHGLPRLADYVELFPDLGDLSNAPEELIAAERELIRLAEDAGATVALSPSSAGNRRDQSTIDPATIETSEAEFFETLLRIGRYRISRIVSGGSFGIVYEAFDERLERNVAIKVPICLGRAVTSDFLNEARKTAKVRHPGIVTVYDVDVGGSAPYIVMEYVDGPSLETLIKSRKLSRDVGVRIIHAVGQAIHFAHQQGLVHRDLKPGNILMEHGTVPRVVDFGLAVFEQEQLEQAGDVGGTAYYMSPEQTRGETHRLDGRSDIWSLGVILYELLTGSRPFGRVNLKQLFDEIQHREPRPPRQFDDSIPRELEYICLRCLAKRVVDRYPSCADLVEDLAAVLASAEPGADSAKLLVEPLVSDAPTSPGVIPRGLRSFEAIDADFFLSLLPGPRDRHGLPESIRFWKNCLENRSDDAQPVCVLYGPSGCGKSSLVKAGVLPRLSSDVNAIFLEASQQNTEQRVVLAVSRALELPSDDANLTQLLHRLRLVTAKGGGPKVVIVVDQFEQWLHSGQVSQSSEFVRALRQCDGANVQCLLLVRDDFWMAVTRLAEQLEVRLIDHQNSAAVDLFDVPHAQTVLTLFGQAYGKLPLSNDVISHAQRQFVQAGIASVQDRGYVSPVLLSLFAEMLKGRDWEPSTLRKLGGALGVAEAFLDETFDSRTAPLEHRRFEPAARAALAAMLPTDLTEIRGPMISIDDLRRAVARVLTSESDLERLLQILDGDLRLITPCDPEGVLAAGHSHLGEVTCKYYQLTHDVMVTALRNWLTRSQRMTYRGRAQLVLAERTEEWRSTRNSRYLPTALECVRIVLLTRRADWTTAQRAAMLATIRRHSVRGTIYAAVAGLIVAALVAVTPGKIDRLANANALQAVRLAALDDLDLSQVDQMTKLCAILAKENDSQLLLTGFRRLKSWAESASSSEYEKSATDAVRGLAAHVLSAHPEATPEGEAAWEGIQEIAAEVYGTLSPASDIWPLAVEIDEKTHNSRVAHALSRWAEHRPISGDETSRVEMTLIERLPDVATPELALAGLKQLTKFRQQGGRSAAIPSTKFFRWLFEFGDQADHPLEAGTMQYLDSLSPDQLATLIIKTANEDSDLRSAAQLLLQPYAKAAAIERVERLGDWSESQLLQAVDQQDGSLSVDHLDDFQVYHLQAIAVLSQYGSAAREAVYAQACGLMHKWPLLDEHQAFEPTALAIALLYAKQPASPPDPSLIKDLSQALREATEPAIGTAAARALYAVAGADEEAVEAMSTVARSSIKPIVIRRACLAHLTQLVARRQVVDDDALRIQSLLLEVAADASYGTLRIDAVTQYGRLAPLDGLNGLRPLLLDPIMQHAAVNALWGILRRHPMDAGRAVAGMIEFLALDYSQQHLPTAPGDEIFAWMASGPADPNSRLAIKNIADTLEYLSKNHPREEVRTYCRSSADHLFATRPR